MTPYYDHDGITIYHGDCADVAPSLSDVDLVLTDPPYGISYEGPNFREGSSFAGVQIVGDNVPFDPRWMLSYGRCVIFGANNFAHLLPPGGWVVWSKVQDNRWTGGMHKNRSLAEVAWTNCHRHVALYNCYWAGMFYRGEEKGTNYHPTQKPVSLMRWILDRTSKPGDLIFDPYMGSGPVAQACQDLGRRYIGVEIVEEYCQVAVNRLAQGVLAL